MRFQPNYWYHFLVAIFSMANFAVSVTPLSLAPDIRLKRLGNCIVSSFGYRSG